MLLCKTGTLLTICFFEPRSHEGFSARKLSEALYTVKNMASVWDPVRYKTVSTSCLVPSWIPQLPRLWDKYPPSKLNEKQRTLLRISLRLAACRPLDSALRYEVRVHVLWTKNLDWSYFDIEWVHIPFPGYIWPLKFILYRRWRFLYQEAMLYSKRLVLAPPRP